MTWAPEKPSTMGATSLDRYFHITERGSNVRTELIAGGATWLTMAYIIFVNPSILGTIPDHLGNFVSGGKAFEAAKVAAVTSLVAGILCLLMGAYANYPFAMAAGLGLNAFVTFTLVGTFGLTWPQAMGVIVWEGLMITLLVLTKFREAVLNAIPLDLKRAIGVGIGAFIAFIGLVNAGIVIHPEAGTIVTLNPDLRSLHILVFVIGLALTMALVARRVRGALLGSIVLTTVIASIINVGFAHSKLYPKGIASVPAKWVSSPNLSIVGNFTLSLKGIAIGTAIALVMSVMLSDFFDTMGTVVGIAGRTARQRGATSRYQPRASGGLDRRGRRRSCVGLVEHDLHRERGGRLRRGADRVDGGGRGGLIPLDPVPVVSGRNDPDRGDGRRPDHRRLLHDGDRQGHQLERPGHRYPGAPGDPRSAADVQHHERRRGRIHRLHRDPAPSGRRPQGHHVLPADRGQGRMA
jgi:hypothetical protein